jgi:site-specific DNA-methyltransferase (adenine-specific)
MNIDLRQGNCLEVMKSIPDKSIDAIITDPPYGTTACKWDSVIPFDLMWEQLNRVIKPNGAIVLFGSEPFSSALRMSNIKNYKYDWVWEKENSTGFQLANVMPLKLHENILVFSKGFTYPKSNNKMVYIPQGLIPNIVKRNKRGSKGGYLTDSGCKIDEYVPKFSNYPNSLLRFKRDKEKIHPTQKPLELMEYLIKTYTNENETVLDFTMGSGSTIVACLNTNRNGIGIEMDDKYFEIANNRVEQRRKELEFGSLFNK